MKKISGNLAGTGTLLAISLCLGLTGGCGPKVQMMPTPVLFQEGRINLFQRVPPDRQTNTLEVFYATERIGHGGMDAREYTNEVDPKLKFGRATVQFGSPQTTWDQLVSQSLAPQRDQSVPLTLKLAQEIGPLTQDRIPADPAQLTDAERSFAAQVNRALEDAAQPEVSIYVHGFKVDFEEGVAVGAQLRHFLGRRQVVIVYAWPCRQGMLDYAGDVERAKKCAPNLARLIEFVAAHTRAQHINVLGYSAGGTLVVEGIATLRDRHPELDQAGLQRELRVGNVLLAAADVDMKTFVADKLTRVTDIPQYVQIMMSRNDKALMWSERLRRVSRLGKPDIKELTREQVLQVAENRKLYLIDVSDVKGSHSEGGGMAGHGYWYQNSWISSDVLTTLVWQLPPPQRGLVPIPGKPVWTFPSDYPDRVHDTVTAQVQKLLDKSATTEPARAGSQAVNQTISEDK
jgi:esterase/lipase superfamily enzyme